MVRTTATSTQNSSSEWELNADGSGKVGTRTCDTMAVAYILVKYSKIDGEGKR